MHVYKSDEPDIDFPQVDLLTYLFGRSPAQPDQAVKFLD